VLAGAIALTSCDEPSVHIYSGQLYEQAAGCLDPSTGIDVISGQSTGDNCPPACLVATSNGQTFVYVSTVCPPYPPGFATEQADAAADPNDPCVGAFAALQSGAVCSAQADGGADATAEAGGDGGAEAAADAPPDDAPGGE
jgi:hypothetical protein